MRNEQQLHHIQKSIILSLANKSPLRFSDLQPPRIPNNAFSYHLKKLLQSGYIEQVDGGYSPTRKALKLVAFKADKEKTFSSPMLISTLYVTNKNDEILLLNRNTKPFQGWYGLPSGVIHLGENLQEAAVRELREKTGISGNTALVEAGILDFRYIEEGTKDIFVHAIAFVYKYEYEGDVKLLNDFSTKYGQLSWSKLGRSHILPEVRAIKDIVDSKTYIHVSKDFVEPITMPVFVSN